jgi:hypothetical protein
MNMKFIKCAECSGIISHASLKKGPKYKNLFKRRIIQCENCAAFLKLTRLSCVLGWVLIIVGPFAVVRGEVEAVIITAFTGLFLFLLMAEGYAFRPLDKITKNNTD